jgi:drug/metabolite transporter (DMT)-like permease
MPRRDAIALLLLAALWGASFLFMRIAAPAFGAPGLAAVRVAGAAAMLLPLLGLRQGLGELRMHWRPIAVVGVTNSALPFLCFSQAAIGISAGLSSILNATAPLFAALIGALWWGQASSRATVAGLLLGLAGVAALVWDQAGPRAGVDATTALTSMALCLVASALYGFSGHFTRSRLAGVAPLAVAAGSQTAAAAVLVAPALSAWPQQTPPPAAWLAAAALAVLCTGAAYILYFRLIARVGAAHAIAVTYFVPVFAMLWAWLFLDERISPRMLAGCAIVFVGVGLATGRPGNARQVRR